MRIRTLVSVILVLCLTFPLMATPSEEVPSVLGELSSLFTEWIIDKWEIFHEFVSDDAAPEPEAGQEDLEIRASEEESGPESEMGPHSDPWG